MEFFFGKIAGLSLLVNKYLVKVNSKFTGTYLPRDNLAEKITPLQVIFLDRKKDWSFLYLTIRKF